MVIHHSVAVVAEEEDFYSAGLSAVLKRQVGYASVLRARSLDQLLAILSATPVHLLAMAMDIPGNRGVETIRQVHADYPELRMAVFSQRTSGKDILNMLAAGAHGVILKQNGDCAELLRALRTVSEAGIYVPSMGELEYARPDDRGEEPDILTGLTERQRQVIKLLSKGYPNKVIARELGISPSTVKVHVHAAFLALGVHSRMAVAAALRPMQYAAASRL